MRTPRNAVLTSCALDCLLVSWFSFYVFSVRDLVVLAFSGYRAHGGHSDSCASTSSGACYDHARYNSCEHHACACYD